MTVINKSIYQVMMGNDIAVDKQHAEDIGTQWDVGGLRPTVHAPGPTIGSNDVVRSSTLYCHKR